MPSPAIPAHLDDLLRLDVLDGRAQPPPAAAPTAPGREGDATRSEPFGLGRSMLVAGAAAVTFVLVAVAGGLTATGSSFVEALGIGTFAALWGGGGFGAMIGGVVHAHRAEPRAAVPSPVGSADDRSPALLPPWPSTTPVAGAR
jgi:hypothetical protein